MSRLSRCQGIKYSAIKIFSSAVQNVCCLLRAIKTIWNVWLHEREMRKKYIEKQFRFIWDVWDVLYTFVKYTCEHVEESCD